MGSISSNSVKITGGVLQEEILNPFLFTMCINDIEDYFRKKRDTGLNVDRNNDILLLVYADDVVMLKYSTIKVQKQLIILS